MTRLKQILLAGTLLPALTLTPMISARAQDQSPDKPAKHHREGGGGEHGKRSEGGGQKSGGERKAGREDNGGGAARAKADDDAPRGGGKHKAAGRDENAGGAGRAKAADDDTPRGGGKRKAAGQDENAGGAARGKAANDDSPRGRRKKEADADKPADRDNGTARKKDTAEDRREDRRTNNAERRNERKLDREERRDERKLGNDERRDERKLGNDERRDERKLGNEERRDDRRLGDRDNNRRNGDRDNDRRMGDRDNDRRDNDRRVGDNDRRDGPGVAGGFLPTGNARRLDDLRRDRREVREGNQVFIREPGRTIIRENNRTFIVHDENERYRALGYNVRRERRGEQFIDTVTRPNGDVIITYTDNSGRLLRRARRGPGGREVILIDNGFGGRVRPVAENIVVLPPPQMRIPRDRYIVDYGAANPNLLYDTLSAPPVAQPPQRYTLDQIRYSPDVRNYVRQVDINTINFDSGSWDVPRDADSKLEALAGAINKAIDRNPNAVFLIEGYTDATGNPDDNLSLSDRRAQSVAEILTKDFKIPPENLTTQGYGQQNPKENTDGPSAANRRVVVRNITQLLASSEGSGEH